MDKLTALLKAETPALACSHTQSSPEIRLNLGRRKTGQQPHPIMFTYKHSKSYKFLSINEKNTVILRNIKIIQT